MGTLLPWCKRHCFYGLFFIIFKKNCFLKVDAADQGKLEAAKSELIQLLDKPQLEAIPVLVLGNKKDLPDALDEGQLIEQMNLSTIQNREICCYSISCKEKSNIG